MPRPQPNIQMPDFQTISYGYVVINNIINYIPPGFENMPGEALIGHIPSKVFKDGWNQTVIFWGGCGHYLTTDPFDKQFAKLYGTSWTGQPICYKHMRVCRDCGLNICKSGNADGRLFDNGQSKYYLCTPCFEKAEKDLKKALFLEGLKKGVFGGWF